jgi:MSHA biogenesis protein MshM
VYLEHWGLSRLPFRDEADPDLYFPGESFEAALLKMRYVVENGLGAGLLVGDVGTGKSYLTRLLDARLPSGRGPVVRLVFPRPTSEEFLADLAAELAEHVADEPTTASPRERFPLGVDGAIRRVLRLLDTLAAEGRHPVVVVDEVHLLDDVRLLHTLHLLLNHQPHGRLEFTLLLVGLPIVIPRIERVPQLDDRIAARALVRRMTRRETADYVAHRLEVAGGTASPFDAAATTALFERSGGLPRRVNRLCDMALLVGYADHRRSISADVVEGVAEELVTARAA